MRANKFVHILSTSNHDGVTRGQLFRLLGLSLCKQSPPEDQHLSVLNGAWKAITTLTQASEFIQCIEPWAEFASTNFGVCFCFQMRFLNEFSNAMILILPCSVSQ